MILTPYQIVVPIVSIVAIVYAWSLFGRERKTLWEAILWTVFWGLIAIVAFYPSLLTYLSVVTGIRSQVNAVIVTAIGILTFLVFSIIVRLEELSQRYAKIMRELAIREMRDETKK